MTKYQVFKKVLGDSDEYPLGVWKPLGEFEGNDPKGAVRAGILAMPEEQRAEASTDTFAACASSSWQELSPKVNVETTVSFA